MRLTVECYSGRKADERPVRFWLGGSMHEVQAVLDQWRNLLRREFGVAEVVSAKEPQPKKVITEPAYSILLTNMARQIVVSADGKWLGTVNEGDENGVEIRDAASEYAAVLPGKAEGLDGKYISFLYPFYVVLTNSQNL